mmetsp:Transcript_972/g.1982  ORF Transcript_972/g.1982 Transcript_972/m.1982 type:complete len:137 (-) Transcript_972:506-916(-)
MRRPSIVLALFLLTLCLVHDVSAIRRGMRGKTHVKSRKNADREYRRERAACERGACSGLGEPDHQNCVYKCLSQACYEEVYSADPIEDGEIDTTRSRQFQQCFRTLKRTGAPLHASPSSSEDGEGEGEGEGEGVKS